MSESADNKSKPMSALRKWILRTAPVIGAIVGAVCVWQEVVNLHYVFSRTLMLAVSIVVAGSLYKVFKSPPGLSRKHRICLAVIGALCIAAIRRAVAFVVLRVIDLVGALPSASARPIGTMLTLLAAFLLFGFRYYARAFWGLGEVMVALYAAWNVMPQEAVRAWDLPKAFTAPVIAGSLYLAIRGMDNIQQGYSKDKLLKWLRTGPGRLRWRKDVTQQVEKE